MALPSVLDGQFGGSLSYSVIAVASLLSWGGLRRLTGKRAFDYERKKRLPAEAGEPEPNPAAGVLARLDGSDTLTVGTHGSGTPVRLRIDDMLRSALILGSSGAGKTREVISLVWALVMSMILGRPLDIEIVDIKNETVDFIAQLIGGLLLVAPEEVKAWLRRHVRIYTFTRDRISPLCPYDNLNSPFTDAYTASFRTAVTVDAGTADYTDSTRHARAMLDRVFTDLRWPRNDSAVIAFYTDERIRALIVSLLRDGHLGAYVQSVPITVPKATALAVCRRFQQEMADPQMRAAKGVPPEDVDRLLPKLEPYLTLSRVGPDATITHATAEELCLYRYFNLLASIPTRSPARPLLIVGEELAATVAGSPKLVTPIAQALRTSRSFGVALWGLAQDFENAASTALATTFVLNSRFVLAFQSRSEASWLAPHLPPDFAPGKSDAERRRVFQREIEGLPSREFFLWMKGEPVLRCSAPNVPDPEVSTGRSAEALRAVFDREIGSRSTISLTTAEELIGAWETRLLHRNVAPRPEPTTPATFQSMDDLLRHLEKDDEDADA
jgi:hypothetical protein